MPPEKVTTFLSKGLWKGMTPAERQKLVSLLVVDAVLTTEGLTLELRTENLESIIKEAMDATEN